MEAGQLGLDGHLVMSHADEDLNIDIGIVPTSIQHPEVVIATEKRKCLKHAVV